MGNNMIQAQLDLSRPIGEVFDYVADFRNENEWNVVAHDVRMLTEPPIGKGSRFLGEYDRVGTLEYEILEYDRPRHLLVRATSKWFDSVSTFDLAARDQVSHVIFAIDPKPKGFLKLLAPLMTGMVKGQMEKNMGSLKRSLEARAAR